MVSALAGCDYGDATTGFELAVNTVYPVAKSQADVHNLGDISSASHFFQCPPNSSKLQCYDSYLQFLIDETLKNLSSLQSKRKNVEFKKKCTSSPRNRSSILDTDDLRRFVKNIQTATIGFPT